MNLNFPLLLVCATAATAAISLLDKLILAKQRPPRVPTPWLPREAHSLFPVFLIVLLIRSFLFQPFTVPTGSLEPTIMPGDFIAVNMSSYGWRLPVWHSKIANFGSPKRGDIVLFRWPVNPNIDFVKRVIGLPGDRISYRNKVFYINGKPAKQTLVGKAVMQQGNSNAPARQVNVYEENLLGVHHKIYRDPNVSNQDFQNLQVPAGHYLMIGDNRDNSDDSRYWGFVPEKNIIGKALFVWFNWNSHREPSIDWHRIGTRISPN